MAVALFTQTSCIILSAGSSLRMGENKALLKFDANQTFLQKITETYLLAGIDQVIVVVNSELSEIFNKSSFTLSSKVKLVVNYKPELGRFYSIQTGVKLIPTGNYCFFQNIDNPFTSKDLLEELFLHKNEADIILPAFHKKSGHPVLLNPLVVQRINNEIDYEIRIDAFFKQFTRKKIGSTDPKILLNINSPDDYLNAGFMV